jgi:hypothetical protein
MKEGVELQVFVFLVVFCLKLDCILEICAEVVKFVDVTFRQFKALQRHITYENIQLLNNEIRGRF